MIFRGVFGLFYQKYPKGGPLENFEKNKKKNFFESPLKSFIILIWGHTKNFGPKKWFLGVFLEGGSQREKKSNLAFGVALSSSRSTAPREQTYWWLHCSSVVCRGKLQLYIDHNTYLMGSWSICQYLKLWEGRYRFMAFFCSKFWQDVLIPQPMNNIFVREADLEILMLYVRLS